MTYTLLEKGLVTLTKIDLVQLNGERIEYLVASTEKFSSIPHENFVELTVYMFYWVTDYLITLSKRF